MAQADHPLADLYARPGPDAWRALGDGFVSTVGRARRARWLIALTVATNALSIVFLAEQRSLLGKGPGNITLDSWDASSTRLAAVGFVEFLLFVAAGILFLRWLHLSYRNLRELGTEGMRFTPGWAVGYWFVPILNVWRPRQILDDLWRATDAKADESQAAWRTLPRSWFVGAWWCAWVVTSFVEIYAANASSRTFADLQHRNTALLVSCVLQIVTGVVLFKLVGELTRRQDARAAARGAIS